MTTLVTSTNFEKNIKPLLDTCDDLRRILGRTEKNIQLPSITVVGNQSAGKSSVIERITGCQLPKGDNI